jgi:hypothetical protein
MIELLIIILALAIIARESPRLGGCLEILIIVCIIPIVLMMLPIWVVMLGLIVIASGTH